MLRAQMYAKGNIILPTAKPLNLFLWEDQCKKKLKKTHDGWIQMFLFWFLHMWYINILFSIQIGIFHIGGI